ncbi:3-hydroxyacyl-CoA dehydrogenase NAD-binding domain-containing protein [Bradyrhizobium sp. WSM1743]|uniref:3-hydroxyacyl-CoA dehydrogenase NAD-binding domain-containing protein n=1 Tax=Bradyrhizobium sp. WSM1743 TaxID=318996 RepID=UPI00040FBAC0|nr:3-hydroxyacyl-CoA dehydrogenase NAD-binding domain-containing protein [Bradyrhizobium sp. WSM1743]
MSQSTKVVPAGLPRAVGLLGGGVIGSGWAARFILNGVDVRLYGPSAGAVERVRKVLVNARRAYRRLTIVPLPAEGSITVVDSVEDAVRGVDLVQESAPERLELKQKLLAAAGRAAGRDVLICSSTSGFRPTLLQAKMDHPERLLVAHPFQPVYMLPLVELCGGERTAPEMLERAAAIFRAVGMHPLVVRKEVDGFIANRLGDALAREALWLVHDDFATLGEIDDAIRYSWGLRRAVIGAYRMVDGGAGMRQYMEQWAFKWPWSRLTDRPNINRAFLDKTAEQADTLVKADPLSVPAAQKRDDLLVAVLRGLRSERYGPGETLARWEQALCDRAPQPQLTNTSTPVRTPTLTVTSDWVDRGGRLAELRYLELCGYACSNLLRCISVDDEYLRNHGYYHSVETHLSQTGTLHIGDRIESSTQVLNADENRMRLFHVLTREGDKEPIATGEQMLVHVETGSGRIGPAQGEVRERLLELARLHAELPYPERAGTSIALR